MTSSATSPLAGVIQALRLARDWWRDPEGKQGRLIILVGLNILMLIVAFTTLIVRHFDTTIVAASAVRAEQVAKTAAYQLQLALFMVDHGLQRAERRALEANGAVTQETLVLASQFPGHLKVNLGFVNADGDLVATMRIPKVEPLRLLDREFVRPHFAGLVTGTYVGRPVVERLSNRWSLPVSRAVRTANGNLLGVVIASLDAAALGEMLHDVSLGTTDILDIASPNGEVWIRWPRYNQILLSPIPQSISTDTAYIGASADVPGWPLRVEVGLDPATIAAGARPFQMFIVGGAAMGALLVAFFSALLFGKTREATLQRDEIAARQKHLLAMLDAIPADIFEFDAKDRLILSNVQARMSFLGSLGRTGDTLREIMLRAIAKRSPDRPVDESSHWLEDNLDFFEAGGSREERDARDAWRRTYITPLPGGGRVVLRVDISELKRGKAQLRASEARYAELVGSLPDALLTIGESGRVLYASEASTEVLGRTPSDIVGRRLARFIVERDYGLIMEGLQRLREAPDKPQTIVCESVRPDGSRRFVQIKFKVRVPASGDARPAEGTSVQLTAVVRDIHDQHMLARKLDQEAANLTSVFEATGASILLLDADQRVKLANHAFLFLSGATQDEVVGKRFDELGFGAIPSANFDQWRSTGRGRSLKPVEFDVDVMISESQRRVMRMTANPATDQNGVLSHIVLIGVDDTDRRMAEIRLFDSSRLTNLGEMASGIAHEINQPLAIIRLAAESVSEELEMESSDLPPPLSAFLKQKLDRITAQTERASGIIRDLRTVARKPGNEALPFDLGEAVRVGCDLLREQMRLDRVDLNVDLTLPGPRVLGEAGRIQQVIINLVNNARDALIERTPRPERGALGKIDVLLETDEKNGNAVLIVQDNGTGIPEKVLPRLFEPFFTTKPVGKGTGLGLSISYDIVNRMSGKLSAENRPEGGARFRVTFPIAKAPELRTAA